MGYAIDEFLPCYKAVCRLTQMEYCGSVYTLQHKCNNRRHRNLSSSKGTSVEHAERLIQLRSALMFE